MLRAIRVLFVVSWTLYPAGYLVPAVAYHGDGAVARQILFTVADMLSKVVYDVLLSRAAQIRSAA